MKFELDEEQVARYKEWAKDVAAKGVEKQKADLAREGREPDAFTHLISWKMGYPYTGAIGGEITFSFTPTGLGEICVVKDSVTGEELNLTDYDSW